MHTLSGLLLENATPVISGGNSVRRLYSTFAFGWPGVALLFMRLIAAAALLARVLLNLESRPPAWPFVLTAVTVVAGVFLLLGLWTPIVGGLMAAVEFGRVFARQGDFWSHILLATLCVALMLLGPGAWSVDARLFGWKRIEIPENKKSPSSPPKKGISGFLK